MKFDRLGFKAISKHDGEWKFATLNFVGDSCSVSWQREWENPRILIQGGLTLKQFANVPGFAIRTDG